MPELHLVGYGQKATGDDETVRPLSTVTVEITRDNGDVSTHHLANMPVFDGAALQAKLNDYLLAFEAGKVLEDVIAPTELPAEMMALVGMKFSATKAAVDEAAAAMPESAAVTAIREGLPTPAVEAQAPVQEQAAAAEVLI